MSDNTKTRLLDAASRLFSEKGFSGVSVNEICQLAETNIASVNYHFKNKQCLYDEVWTYAFQQSKHPGQMSFSQKDCSAEQKLKSFIENHIRQALDQKDKSVFTRLLLREFIERNISDISIILDVLKPLRKNLNSLLSELAKDKASEEELCLLRYTLMSHCIMPLFSPIAKKNFLQASIKTETVVQHIFDIIILLINSIVEKTKQERTSVFY